MARRRQVDDRQPPMPEANAGLGINPCPAVVGSAMGQRSTSRSMRPGVPERPAIKPTIPHIRIEPRKIGVTIEWICKDSFFALRSNAPMALSFIGTWKFVAIDALARDWLCFVGYPP